MEVLSRVHNLHISEGWSDTVHLGVLIFSHPTVLRISNAKEATAMSA